MKTTLARVAVLATLAIALAAPAVAAPPATPRQRPMPKLQFPKARLHTEFVVEVNKKGQVVLVKSGKDSSNRFFNAQTYGNVLQMWIRHPDGTAEVGLYHVTYDYDPKTHNVRRGIALLKAGGTWGNKLGAANQMIEHAKKEAAKERAKANAGTLPPLHIIEGGSASPTPKPHHA